MRKSKNSYDAYYAQTVYFIGNLEPSSL